MLAKIKISDLEAALEHIKKNSRDTTVEIGQDEFSRARLILKVNDTKSKEIKITLFDADNHMFPEVTQTQYLGRE